MAKKAMFYTFNLKMAVSNMEWIRGGLERGVVALTGAECESSNLIHAESRNRCNDSPVGGSMAEFLNIAKRCGDLLVVSIELPEGHDFRVNGVVL